MEEKNIFKAVEEHWLVKCGASNVVYADTLVPNRPLDHTIVHPILESGCCPPFHPQKNPVEAAGRILHLLGEMWSWDPINDAWSPQILSHSIELLNRVNRTSQNREENDLFGGSDGIGIPVWRNNLVPVLICCMLISAKFWDNEDEPLPCNFNYLVFKIARFYRLWPGLESVKSLNMAEMVVIRALFHAK